MYIPSQYKHMHHKKNHLQFLRKCSKKCIQNGVIFFKNIFHRTLATLKVEVYFNYNYIGFTPTFCH